MRPCNPSPSTPGFLSCILKRRDLFSGSANFEFQNGVNVFMNDAQQATRFEDAAPRLTASLSNVSPTIELTLAVIAGIALCAFIANCELICCTC